MNYTEFDTPEISALGLMMYLQKLIEIDQKSLGWGYEQCIFVEKEKLRQVCIGELQGTDFKHKMLVKNGQKKVHSEFQFTGKLSSLDVGLEITIHAKEAFFSDAFILVSDISGLKSLSYHIIATFNAEEEF